ncbi:hypothetical protein CNMCM5793_001791 [Aspergillus hiratsukae]|uniref:Aminoglycoside phosphotransferase domain-containing protein n=1 Tax=Aspergillus hiratsukae TaxID=1194566 RepID=A0A8H6UEW7_9EURO|nr:hypothetical protein CNMCM5793_001791 [Aspergillus hiratsukae]
MANDEEPIRLTPSMIPDSPNFDVKDTSFFRKWRELPSPKDVQAQAESQHLAGVNPDPRRVYRDDASYLKPPPVVYGWRTDGDVKYIYMEYIRGQTLEQAWDELEPEDRDMICRELRTICDNLRRLEQDPSDPFVGNIARGPLYDRALGLDYIPDAGPFTTVQEFHDWFTFLPRRPMPDPYSVPIEPYRYELPDDIKFTHGDLHRSNIIISSSPPYGTLAVIDWEQSGWFPAYWEARKAQFTALWGEEWWTRYLPTVLDQYAAIEDSWWYYIAAIGP